MRLKLICCEVFFREACFAVAASPHVIDPEFTPKGAHEDPTRLRDLIQSIIDKIDKTGEKGEYNAILLGFGLCGNATNGLRARSIPLVIPRAHDCCTILLGSRKSFLENFGSNLSAEWTSTGYAERGVNYLRETDMGKQLGLDKSYRELVEQYGEENAKFIWDTLHPDRPGKDLIFIEIPETAHLNYRQKFEKIAAEEGRTLKVLQGDMRLIRALVNGEWNEDEFLVVEPGKTIMAVYDQDRIFTA